MSKIVRKPYRLKRKIPLLKRKSFWIFVLVLVTTGALFYFFVFSSLFQIDQIGISGNKEVLTEDIEKEIQVEIEKRFLFFSSESIFLTNLNQINGFLLKRFPQITEINSRKDLPRSLVFKIRERVPVAIWCLAEDWSSTSSLECFYLDQEGIIFKDVFSEGEFKSQLVIKSEGDFADLSLGTEVLDKANLNLIFEIQREVEEKLEIGIKEFIILPQKLVAVAGEGWKIYFDSEEDIKWQLTKLNLVLENKIPSDRRKDLEYIELRFGNHAPFKYR